MTISRRDLYAAGEPFGDSATRVEGHRVIYGGGGSGSSGTPFYANQDKLFGVQADIAQNLYGQYAAYSPQALNGMSQMVADGNSGAYTERMRGMASSDASASAAMERQATERNMSSMGVNPNDPRFAGAMRSTALGNAANKAQGMNKATQYGDEMTWARNSDFYNSLSGMPSQSAAMLASSGAGYGQMAGAQQSQQNANTAGYGQFGGMIAGGMFKRDGGYIREPRFALGGQVGSTAVQHRMPTMGDWRQRPSGFKAHEMSTMDKIGAVAQPIAMHYAADYAGKAIKEGASGMFGKGAVATQAAAPVASAAIMPAAEAAMMGGQSLASGATAASTIGNSAAINAAIGTGASTAAGVGTAAGGMSAAAGAAGGIGAAGGAAAGGAAAAGGGAMAALGTAMPWVGGAMLVGSLLDLWKDGGHVSKKAIDGRLDMRTGGETPPIGTETSDSIPAWLSKGEYVVNADAVKKPGVKKKLEAINKSGLEKRYGKKGAK